MFNPLNALGEITKPIANVVSQFVEDKDKANELTSALSHTDIGLVTTLIKEQSGIIQAEIHSKSWLARNWRPLSMLFFLHLIAVYWYGFTPENITEAAIEDIMDIIKIGIGGYIPCRTAEKLAPSIINAIKDKK